MASVYNRGTKDKPNWWIKYKDESGAWQRKATKQPTKEAAKRYAVAMDARTARRLIGMQEDLAPSRPPMTVWNLCERFLSEYQGQKIRNFEKFRAQRRYDLSRRLRSFSIAKLDAHKLKTADVERWRDELRAAGYSAKTANLSLELLRLIFAWAIRRDLFDGKNPASGILKFQTRPLDESYTLEQVQKILKSTELPISVVIALYTGMRRGEISALRWDDVDFEASKILVQRSYFGPTKTGKSRLIPLHAELKKALIRWRPLCPPTELGSIAPIKCRGVFRQVSRTDPVVYELRELLRKAGCPPSFMRPWHAFRHTFATLFLQAGGSQAALERILGHSTTGNRNTSMYLHVDMAFLSQEMARLSYLAADSQ